MIYIYIFALNSLLNNAEKYNLTGKQRSQIYNLITKLRARAEYYN